MYLVFAGSTEAARAQDRTEFYKGKTITITIGFNPGGNYDFVGRLVSRHIGKQLPGNPNGVGVNMAGAGSFRAANYLFNAAPKDGTMLGIVSSSIAIEEALGTKGVNYKSAEFNWIGRVSFILQVLTTYGNSKTRRIEDALTNETPMAGTGPGSPSEGYPKVLNGVLGTRFKVVSGYRSSTEGMLAMEKGEVDGGLPSWNNIKRSRTHWIAEKKAYPLVQFVFERHPDLPNVPTSVELAKTPADRAVLAFYTSSEELGRSIIAPPGVPADRIKLLRQAFDAMLKDKAFLAEVEKTKLEFNPLSGETMQKLVADTAATPKDVIERTRNLLGRK
jgi:tripartite-type tricarboxylate transporter receptor subunit TctC